MTTRRAFLARFSLSALATPFLLNHIPAVGAHRRPTAIPDTGLVSTFRPDSAIAVAGMIGRDEAPAVPLAYPEDARDPATISEYLPPGAIGYRLYGGPAGAPRYLGTFDRNHTRIPD